MSDIRKVWPREPLMAEHGHDPLFTWEVGLPGVEPMIFTDAEFAASFLDAAVLTELIDAAREVKWDDDFGVVTWMEWLSKDDGEEVHERITELRRLSAALVAFDAVMLPDTETQ